MLSIIIILFIAKNTALTCGFGFAIQGQATVWRLLSTVNGLCFVSSLFYLEKNITSVSPPQKTKTKQR